MLTIQFTFGPRSLKAIRLIVDPPLWLIVSLGLFDVAGIAYGVAKAMG